MDSGVDDAGQDEGQTWRRISGHDRLHSPAEKSLLDEADSLFDMGFLPDVRRIISRMPARAHTLLFSATMPPVIAKLANEVLRDPVSVQIGRRSSTAVGITQAAYPVPAHLKTALLRHLLLRPHPR